MSTEHERMIDRLVAEKVMGWEWWSSCGASHLFPPNMDQYDALFQNNLHFRRGKEFNEVPIELAYSSAKYEKWTIRNYSTDIADAWEVVNSEAWGSHWAILPVPSNGDWAIWRIRDARGDECVARGKTAPLAICLAAIKALGIEVEAAKDRGGE